MGPRPLLYYTAGLGFLATDERDRDLKEQTIIHRQTQSILADRYQVPPSSPQRFSFDDSLSSSSWVRIRCLSWSCSGVASCSSFWFGPTGTACFVSGVPLRAFPVWSVGWVSKLTLLIAPWGYRAGQWWIESSLFVVFHAAADYPTLELAPDHLETTAPDVQNRVRGGPHGYCRASSGGLSSDSFLNTKSLVPRSPFIESKL